MKLIALLSAVCFTACVQATVSDDFTVEKNFSYALPTLPTLPPGSPVYTYTYTQSTTADVSDVVSKLTSLGNLSFNVSSSVVNTNMPMGFLTHIEVDVRQTDGQDLVVVNTAVNTTGTSVSLPVVASDNDLLAYLGSGEITLSVSITVSTASGEVPSGTLNLIYDLGLNAAESVNKSL